MSFAKSIVVMLAVAIGYPLCCCFGGVEMAAVSTSSDADPMANHACCHGDETPANASSSDQDCPHEEGKSFQLNQSAQSADSLLKPSLLVATLLPALELNPLSEATAKDRFSAQASLSPPPTPLAQKYCVYLL